MKKEAIIIAAAALVVAAGLAGWFLKDRGGQLVGGSCGTVTPGYNDECCTMRNAGKPHIMCAGGWKYVSDSDECRFVCSGSQAGGGGKKACTEEAKLCPDGSAVGRDPKNDCEFPPCPTDTTQRLIGGDRDEHGCLIAAGYSWNGSAGECMRSWSGEVQEERTLCLDSQRGHVACTMDYRPVCGWFNDTVRCFAYPCAQTYSNPCMACSDVKVKYYTDGECPKTGKDCGTCPQIATPPPGWCGNGTVIAGSVDGCGCRGPPKCVKGGSMTEEEAVAVAQESACADEGELNEGTATRNDYTKTWWIDLTPNEPKPGCNPACVVSEDSGTAEVNWRCTDLVQPD